MWQRIFSHEIFHFKLRAENIQKRGTVWVLRVGPRCSCYWCESPRQAREKRIQQSHSALTPLLFSPVRLSVYELIHLLYTVRDSVYSVYYKSVHSVYYKS